MPGKKGDSGRIPCSAIAISRGKCWKSCDFCGQPKKVLLNTIMSVRKMDTTLSQKPTTLAQKHYLFDIILVGARPRFYFGLKDELIRIHHRLRKRTGQPRRVRRSSRPWSSRLVAKSPRRADLLPTLLIGCKRGRLACPPWGVI